MQLLQVAWKTVSTQFDRFARLAGALWRRWLYPVFRPILAQLNKSLVRKTILHLGLLGLGGASMLIVGAWFYFSPRIPPADSLLEVELQSPLLVYTADAVLIGEFGEQKRRLIPYEKLSPLLIQAFLAAEDDDFFNHSGVDYPALVRAAMELVLSGGQIRSGGGTITMQVARNYLLNRDRTFYRKFREIFMAIELEERFSKEKIMEFYANGVFFGNRSYGVAAAAQTYFDREADQLTLPEMALLVSLPKAPSRLNPLRAPALAKIRRNWVLSRMEALGYIDEEAFVAARNAPIWLSSGSGSAQLDARYAAEMARSEAVARFGRQIYKGGYKVYTTLDSGMQKAAVQSLQAGLIAHDRRHGWRPPPNLAELFSKDTRQHIADRDLTGFARLDSSLAESGRIGEIDDILSVLDQLAKYPNLDNRRPGVVLVVDRSKFWVLTRDGRIEEVTWQPNDLSWARQRRDPEDPDNLGYPPRSFEDLLRTGDVVYLKYGEDEPIRLTQIPQTEGALVSLDSPTGAIRSLVGGFHFQRSKFNRAVQAHLQPGSVFKPFLYAAALENGDTPASIYDDAPVVFEDLQLEDIWRPENSSGRFVGPTRLRDALVYSLNMVSIRMLEALGVEQLHNYLNRTFRFPAERMKKNLSLALGSAELSPLEIATAYASFSNGGYRVYPWLISHITDAHGQVIWRQVPQTAPGTVMRPENGTVGDAAADLGGSPLSRFGSQDPADRNLDARVAYQVSDILREVMIRGTADGAANVLQRKDFSGKTGTTNDAKNTWFSGYNGSFVSVVWVGYDQPQSLGSRESGATVALPIWLDYIGKNEASLPVSPQTRPTGLVAVRINPQTGKRAAVTDYSSIFEIFRREKMPIEDLSDSQENPEDIF